MSSTNVRGSAPSLDLADVRRFLSARSAEVSGIEPLRRGEWSSAYAFREGGQELVARFSRFAEDFEKDRLASRHRSAALPIPRIVEIGEALGGHYAISERAHGAYLESLDEPTMRRTLPALFSSLDGMRTADLSASSGFGLWGADGNAPHATWRDALLDVGTDRPGGRVHGWRARLETSTVAARAFDEGVEAMRRLIDDCPDERHLVHSDLVYYNVLSADGHVTAVLDWGSSIYGDFLYDIAWLAFWSRWYPSWNAIDIPREAARHFASIGVPLPAFAERLRCYELHIGLDGMAYSAFRGRADEVAVRAARVRELAAIAP